MNRATPDSARPDATAVKREFERLTGLAAQSAVRPVALGIGWLYVGFVAAHLAFQPRPLASILAPSAALSAMALLALARQARLAPSTIRGHRGLALIAAITLANSVLHLALTRDPVQSTNLYLVVVGCGVLLLSQPYVIGAIGLSVAGWLAVALADRFQHDLWLHTGIGLASAAVLSVVIHFARNRFFYRIAALEVSARSREIQLTSSESRYRHLFDASPAMICIHDLEGVLIDVNAAGAEALGARRSDLIGERIDRFLTNAPRGVHRDYLDAVSRLGHAGGLAQVTTMDGRSRVWLYENSLFEDPALGRYVVGTAVDVTELQDARAQLEAAKADLEIQVSARTAELRAANARLEDELQERERMESRLLERHKLEGLGRLAGGVAHEFNNILGIIRGNAELAVLDAMPESPSVEYLQEIEEATVRGADLVSKILSFSRPETRGHAPFDVAPLLQETVDFLRGGLPANVTLELASKGNLPEVIGSPTQIRQVLVDLVANSRQAMGPEGGWIRVLATSGCHLESTRGQPEDPDFVRIEVLDNGHGIPARNLPRVFDPFFTTREVGQGYGLGLSVAHGVIRGHGGDIRVESPANGGTRVVFYLPQSAPSAVIPNAPPGLDRAADDDGYILVVDDEPAIVRIARTCLERRGHRVLTASDGVMALTMLRDGTRRISLLVTDLSMPGLSGEDLLRQARVVYPALRALVMSGFGPTVDLDRLGGAMLTSVLSKPFRAADLEAAIETILPSPASSS